ncbi:lactosylceramide 4-alpha-galactosyltransferase-like [Cherax quadricarinatus]|uniref:lactosylceramide 4-alpha-galactosyltransferase-like n=1 Tax=Cherax quadricarinatus TaxID=27406 RepID=UPI00387E75CC
MRACVRPRVWRVSAVILLVLFLSSSMHHTPTRGSGGSRRRLRRPSSLTLLAPKTYINSRGGENYYIKRGGMWDGTTMVCPHPESPQDDDSFLTLPDFFRCVLVSLESEWEDARNIVLAETSCNSRPAYRAWCAVESMAQQNPEARVWYVMTAPAVEMKDGLPPRLLQQYTNLQVVTTDLGKVFSNTPLMPLYTNRTWNINTTWPAVNLSDMVRLALVWRVGGFYSDTDVVCISSLAALRNVVFPDSYVIHMWNKMSHLQPIFKDSGSIYDVAAKTFCPVTRAVATAHSSLY